VAPVSTSRQDGGDTVAILGDILERDAIAGGHERHAGYCCAQHRLDDHLGDPAWAALVAGCRLSCAPM
jgi:hypothetical protein